MWRAMTRTLGLGCAVLVVIGALYLAMTHVLRPGSRQSLPPSAHVAESGLRSGTEHPGPPRPGSHDTDGHPRASLERAWPVSELSARASLPTRIEDAIESNPKLAEDLACRDP